MITQPTLIFNNGTVVYKTTSPPPIFPCRPTF